VGLVVGLPQHADDQSSSQSIRSSPKVRLAASLASFDVGSVTNRHSQSRPGIVWHHSTVRRTWPEDWNRRRAGDGWPKCAQGRSDEDEQDIRFFTGRVSDAYRP